MKKHYSRRSFLNKVIIGTGGMLTMGGIGFGAELKKVTLIGDSIRLGYQPYTDLYLMDNANIWGPDEDCMHTVNILSNAYKWFQENRTDIIHINAGLFDLRTIPGNSRFSLIPVKQYADNIERIIKYIHKHQPEAIIIWASTTPVINEKTGQSESFSVSNENVIKYNEAANEKVSRLGVPVNDLYRFVMDGDPDKIMAEDGIHFTDTGYQFLGEQVANAVGIFLNN